jgi:predicted enzyme related to lactoylglutathione lyase
MIKRLSHTVVHVLDQDSAKEFYSQKLAFEVRSDEQMGPIRWLTVSPPEQHDVELLLLEPGAPLQDEETARTVRALVPKGAFGGASFETDDCRATFRELSERGVEFVEEPSEQPWGISAVFKDDSGNWFNLVERTG